MLPGIEGEADVVSMADGTEPISDSTRTLPLTPAPLFQGLWKTRDSNRQLATQLSPVATHTFRRVICTVRSPVNVERSIRNSVGPSI